MTSITLWSSIPTSLYKILFYEIEILENALEQAYGYGYGPPTDVQLPGKSGNQDPLIDISQILYKFKFKILRITICVKLIVTRYRGMNGFQKKLNYKNLIIYFILIFDPPLPPGGVGRVWAIHVFVCIMEL